MQHGNSAQCFVTRQGLVFLALVVLGSLVCPPAKANDFFVEGMTKATAEDWPAALDLFERAMTAEPNNLRAGAEYRQAMIAADAYDRGLDYLTKLAEENPKAPNILLNLGFAHVDKIPVEGAITQVILANSALEKFSAALELEETWLLRYTRGNSYLYWPAIFGRTQLGIDDLQRAIEMAAGGESYPYHGRAWAALGDGYWRLEDSAEAIETYKKGLELYPDNVDLKQRAGLDEAELDMFLEALFDTNVRVATHLREIWEAHDAHATE